MEIRVERTAEWKVADSGLNLVTFTDPEPFDTGMCDKALYIACTLVFHTEETGEIPMVKIAFNPYKKHSSLGWKGAHDLGVVLLHELGHAIGLDHSGALDAVMSPVVELAVEGGGDAVRRLSADDVATVAMAYPVVEPEVGPSYLAGAVMRDGTAVAKAHVMAFDRAGQVAAAGLSDGAGRFRLQVGEGEYRLAVEPLDGPVMAAQMWAEQAGQTFGSLWWTAGGGSGSAGAGSGRRSSAASIPGIAGDFMAHPLRRPRRGKVPV
ncbi:MAG: matrixin family metalloprotease [Planctomycetaceae bacterium]|nr:matrixin family metalloprotease [Planctomycetaceae bacterium]